LNRGSVISTILLFSVLGAMSGCGRQLDSNIAARVGPAEITIQELREFTEGTPVLLQSKAEGLDAVMDYLQTMIDMELMLLDARNQGLDAEEDFVIEYAKERETKLVEEYVTRIIAPKITISPDELRAAFKESVWSRMLEFAHIQTATFEAAQAAIAELEKGMSFESVARERSINAETAANGGALDWGFIGRDDLERTRLGYKMGEALFALPVGGLSRPLNRGKTYEVFKVLAEEDAPERYLHVFRQHMAQVRGNEVQLELVQKLKEKYHVQIRPEAVAFLVQLGSEQGLWATTPEEKAQTLLAYDGSSMTVGEFIEVYWNPARFQVTLEFTEKGVIDVIDRFMLLSKLFEKEALEEGIDRKPAVADWLVDKNEAMLLNRYKDGEVQTKVDSTEESIRKYYDNHNQQFMDPNTTLITEILVESKARVDSLIDQIGKGADMSQLAIEQSIRQFAKTQKGQIHLHPYERPVFGPLHDAAMDKAPIGALQGPVELEEGFSIFRVEERTPAMVQSYERSRSRAKYWLRKREEKIHFEAMITGLREKYAAEVNIYDENLQSVNP
jgi:parvulin-like peptidyl-prolyl isomerase